MDFQDYKNRRLQEDEELKRYYLKERKRGRIQRVFWRIKKRLLIILGRF